MQDKTIHLIQNVTTVTTIGLGLASLYLGIAYFNVAMTLLSLVTLGTAYDFVSHIVGRDVSDPKPSLEIYARLNFAALCFGIPFTSLAASFVVGTQYQEGLSAALASWWLEILIGSLLFGALFLVARYKTFVMHGGIEYTLDKSHGYTKAIFLIRRVLLAIAAVVALIAMYEGFAHTSMGWWTAAFSVLFIATIPLHILHRPIASMLGEAATLWVLFYGTLRVFYM